MPRFLLSLGAVLLTVQVAVAQAVYPVVFGDNRVLAELGIQMRSHVGGVEVPQFDNKCHYYGDGGPLITLSDDFVAPYLAKGFSVPSLCMGVYAGVRFDPDTGRRLATFMVADLDAIDQYGFDPFAITEEFGLEIPTCFASGRPLTDCDFKFDPKTGAALNEQVRQNVRGLGNATDAIATKAIRAGQFAKECATGGPVFPNCRTDFYPDEPDNEFVKGFRGREEPQGLNWPVTFLDVSDEFPAGYGYAIFASGEAGPSAELDAEKIAVDPKRRASKAIMESLIVKLKQ
ncbi:MAG: hypothetical protein ACPGFA_03010 [Pikeienuella sp.]